MGSRFQQRVPVGKSLVGAGYPAYIVGEIGINHDGDPRLLEVLVRGCKAAGVDAVKMQKRSVSSVYTMEELVGPRRSPFGGTNADLKFGLEFGAQEYDLLDGLCRDLGLPWFASCWDLQSVPFIEAYSPPAYKIPSARLGHRDLLLEIARLNKPVFLSTGMSSLDEIGGALEVLDGVPVVVMHCTSSYPCMTGDLHLRTIPFLGQQFGLPIGFSSHATSVYPAIAAVALGAAAIEVHVTATKDSWGSDHHASLTLDELARLVAAVREVEAALGTTKQGVLDCERPLRRKLWRTRDVEPSQ